MESKEMFLKKMVETCQKSTDASLKGFLLAKSGWDHTEATKQVMDYNQ